MNQTALPALEPAPASHIVSASAPDSYSYLLILRFAATNLVAFALLGAAWMHGLVGRVIAADSSYLCVGMFALFLIGLAICGWRVAQTSRELNEVRSGAPAQTSRAASYLQAIRGRSGESRSLLASALKLKLTARLGAVRQIASALVLIGLIGTVLGFIVVLGGVNPESASDVSAVGPMISTLVEGMGIALYTTLVGAVLNIWLMANCQVLSSGLVKLIAGVVELGERHARA
jgi:hypothetical protein